MELGNIKCMIILSNKTKKQKVFKRQTSQELSIGEHSNDTLGQETLTRHGMDRHIVHDYFWTKRYQRSEIKIDHCTVLYIYI